MKIIKNNIKNNIDMNKRSDMSGILLVDKPKDFTSFDVVAKLRRVLMTKKIGHGGTLDPMATGVLPIFVGKATKAIELISDQDKKYIAGFKLGMKTDTQDITGNVVFERTKKDLKFSKNDVGSVLNNFIGDVEQVPPMYSAVKINGQKLYHLARKGQEVERPARKIRIYSLKLLSFDEKTQEGILEAYVSKGTYIRTLVNDIGEQLSVGAVLTSLRRTRALGFELGQSFSLDQIQNFVESSEILSKIISVEEVFGSFEKIIFDEETLKKIDMGQRIQPRLKADLQQNVFGKTCYKAYYKAYDKKNNFLGIGCLNSNQIFKFKIKI